MNILTVQLQDYYQHKVFETVISKRHWSRFESRLRRNVDETLALFDRHNVKATFFALGWLAERFSPIILDIAAQDHEIACAGFWGADRTAVSQSEFREDMRMGKDTLEEVTGNRVDGFRSVRRSFSDADLWMIDLVAEEEFRYDSSVMPSGFRRAYDVDTRYPFERRTRHGVITELPHSTGRCLGYRVPIGGGNFLRQIPSGYTFREFQHWIRSTDQPFMLYFHPWELDSDLPEVSAFDTLTHIRQYRNLGKLKQLLPRYFSEAQFGPAREYLQLECRHKCSPGVPRTPPRSIVVGAVAVHRTPVSVVIPCRNEEASVAFLRRALDELTSAAEPLYQLRYIFVDDKSTDDTVALLRDTFHDSERFTIVELAENRGVSGAIHAGIDEAETEIVCSMDADCSYDPLELLQMIPLLDAKTALVTASPYHPKGSVLGVPGWRLFLSRGLSGIYRVVLTHKLATYTSCFRVYRRSIAQKFRPEYGDFRGIVELLARLDMAGERIKEYPTTLQSRIFGFSKMKTLNTIRDHVRLLARMRHYRRVARAVHRPSPGLPAVGKIMTSRRTTATTIAVIGGGMTGIAAAMRLARAGCAVHLYEARDHLGGLSDSYTWDGITWDRFYHVVLSTDTRLTGLIDELGLESGLFWRSTKSGFYGGGKLVSMSSMGDFIRFPFLSLWQKFRLGAGILTSIGVKDPDKLDRIYVQEWLTRVFGRRVYERIWDPLLRSKLGEARHKTSAAFIWATITRLYGARSGEAKTEQMGHVRGGYRTILDAASLKLTELGVTVHTGSPVEFVRSVDGRVVVRAHDEAREYDQALLTVPAPEVLHLTGAVSEDGEYWQALAEVRYLGVLCLFVVLDRRLSPYYVTNLLDTSLPFTGIMEITNITDPGEFDGRHLVYLPKYVTTDDPFVAETDEHVTEILLGGLRKVHPDLPTEAVLHTMLFRERHVQPLQEVNYLGQTRGMQTPLPGIYVANSTMLYNSTLNNNAAVALAERAVDLMTETAELEAVVHAG